jgi:hypothetical protein
MIGYSGQPPGRGCRACSDGNPAGGPPYWWYVTNGFISPASKPPKTIYSAGNPISSVHAIWKPDLSDVAGFATKYWVVAAYPDDSVSLMDQAARDAVDAAELSAQLDSIADEIGTGVQYDRAFALVVLDEINALRTAATLPMRTAAQLKTPVRNKLDTIS